MRRREVKGVADPVAFEFELRPFGVESAACDEAAACGQVKGVILPEKAADGDEEDGTSGPGDAAGGTESRGHAAAVPAAAQFREGFGSARRDAEGWGGVEEVDEVVEGLALGSARQIDGEGGAEVPDRAEGNDFLGAEVDAAEAGEAAVEFVDDDFVFAGEFGALAEIGFVLGVGGACEGHGGETGAGELEKDFGGDGGEAVLPVAPSRGVAHAGDAAGVKQRVKGGTGVLRGASRDGADRHDFEQAALADGFHAIQKDGFKEGAIWRFPVRRQRGEGRLVEAGAGGADLGGDLPGQGVTQGEVVDVESDAFGGGKGGGEKRAAGFDAAVRMAGQIEACPSLAREGRSQAWEGSGGKGRGT